MKVYYRVIKWRLSQNDCLNRGYILDNFPHFVDECNWIFFKCTTSPLLLVLGFFLLSGEACV